MVIDIHTHIFPDTLAPRAMAALRAECGDCYPPVHDGTAAGLTAAMDRQGVDISVLLPVVTKPTQSNKTNEWTAGISGGRFVGFGGVHPLSDDWCADIDRAVGLGLKGLKFHCEYQGFLLDDPHMLKIYDYALSRGLIVLHHAGFDPAFPPPFRSSPQRFANVVKAMRGGVIIAAHLGGHDQWDDVEAHLAGTDVYLDTSMGFEYFSREQFLRIVQRHGADKILFGSDSPWSDAGREIKHIRALPLPERDIEAILGGNARRILKI